MTPDELWRWRNEQCPHKETVTGLRADCLVCHCELVNLERIACLKIVEDTYRSGASYGERIVERLRQYVYGMDGVKDR